MRSAPAKVITIHCLRAPSPTLLVVIPVSRSTRPELPRKRDLLIPLSVVAAETRKYVVQFGVAESGNLSRELTVVAEFGVKKERLGSTRRGLESTALKSDVGNKNGVSLLEIPFLCSKHRRAGG